MFRGLPLDKAIDQSWYCHGHFFHLLEPLSDRGLSTNRLSPSKWELIPSANTVQPDQNPTSHPNRVKRGSDRRLIIAVRRGKGSQKPPFPLPALKHRIGVIALLPDKARNLNAPLDRLDHHPPSPADSYFP